MFDDDYRIKPSVHIGGEAISANLPEDALKALRQWEIDKTQELIEVLKPFGMHPYDMLPPVYRRIVTPDELREHIGSGND